MERTNKRITGKGVPAKSGDGTSILEKAAKLKNFVKQQKGKLEKGKALHEWMLTQHRLQEECRAAEEDASHAQQSASGFLSEARDAEASAQEDKREQGSGTELWEQVLQAFRSIGVERERGSSSNKTRRKEELERLREALADKRQELDGQEAACSCACPSALSEDSGSCFDAATWQTRLDNLLERYPTACEDADVVDARASLGNLDNAFSRTQRELEATSPPSSQAGWSLKDHETFLRVRRAELAEASATCQQQAEVVARVRRMMPHRTRADVVQHLEWYAERVLWRRKLDDLHVSHSRQVDEMLETLESKLSKRGATLQSAAAAALESVRRETAQAARGTKLANHRQIQATNAQAELQERLALAELETETRRLEECRVREERSKTKAFIAGYRATIESLERERQEEAARGKALREEVAKAEAQRNSERVEYRRGEHVKRAEQLRRAAAASEEREREKEERLAKLRAKVAVHVEADSARVLQPTAAMVAAENAARESELFPVHGFTTDELMKDKRFRLGLALREAGLQSTKAGREALLAVGPRAIKRDTITQFAFTTADALPK